jgi:hypothetical protein
MNDSDHNQTRNGEKSDGNPEAEVAPVPRARASFLYESLLVQEVFRGGVPGLLDNCYGLTPFPARTLD